ncbi:MAG: glutathione S-transferase C-terminal domain-containing protein [Porticoccus sp.]|nr:glutathione S-transferase C-terminal domain-containing protein [Porticoccus sp.]
MSANEICHVEITSFHNELGGEDYPFEKDRYWLFTSKVCPFAHRTEIMRALTGLTDHIGLTIAGTIQTEQGWDLGGRYESADSSASPIADIYRLPGIYKLASPDYLGRASVPVLFDTKTNTIVNNESSEIIRQFDQVATQHFEHSTLYPTDKQRLMGELINELADEFINPIYRTGFAKDQATYQLYFEMVFTYLTKLDKRLGETGAYIAGDQLTLADVHAYPHLARFDAAYHSLYRLNKNFIRAYPNITDYMRRLGEISAFGDTLDVQAFKEGYFLAWNQPTEGYFTPAGPEVNPRSGVAIAQAT